MDFSKVTIQYVYTTEISNDGKIDLYKLNFKVLEMMMKNNID